MTKHSQWFPKEIKPVHPGCYEMNFGQKSNFYPAEYQYWDGKDWWYGCRNPSDRTIAVVPDYFHKEWRGLSTKQGE